VLITVSWEKHLVKKLIVQWFWVDVANFFAEATWPKKKCPKKLIGVSWILTQFSLSRDKNFENHWLKWVIHKRRPTFRVRRVWSFVLPPLKKVFCDRGGRGYLKVSCFMWGHLWRTLNSSGYQNLLVCSLVSN